MPRPLIAALPMYDRAETAAANDRLWRAIRDALGYGPAALTRDADLMTLWQSRDLLLAQTCGYPYRARLHDYVTLVATPDYGLPDLPAGYYQSLFLIRADHPARTLADLDGARFAYNEPLSQSGWAAPRSHADATGLRFGPLLQTGAHRASALAVAHGHADFAALDALTWALICDHDGFAADLRVIARTPPTPGLPLITAKTRDPAPLFAAIETAITELPAATRACLHLNGLVHIPASAYLDVATPCAPPPPPKT